MKVHLKNVLANIIIYLRILSHCSGVIIVGWGQPKFDYWENFGLFSHHGLCEDVGSGGGGVLLEPQPIHIV